MKSDRSNYSVAQIINILSSSDMAYCWAEQGALEAIDRKVDAERALMLARPTETQLVACKLVWRHGYTLAEAGAILGVTPQAVRFNLNLLSNKITKVVEGWNSNDL